jgi:putative methyltransferase (TIGR04325 family)
MKMRLKTLIKGMIPPLLYEALRAPKPFIISSYPTWDKTRLHCTGYDSDSIIQKVKDAALQVKAGKAAFERDSILFYDSTYPLPLLAGLLRVALANEGKLRVLDFGGSLGSTYYWIKPLLSGIKELRWNIIEQKKFVDIGKEMFENNELVFYYSIDECLKIENS